MIAYRIVISSDNIPKRELPPHRSTLMTAELQAKEYMKDHGAVNEVWYQKEGYVQFYEGETLFRIDFEEINIEF